MRKFNRYLPSLYLPLLALLLFALSSCGYHNPYLYSGPHKVIYLANWKNRTSELGLDSKIYQTLLKWFQKSGSITITRNRKGADLALGGEIVSIDLPSLSYGSNNSATQVKVRLQVRYILKDIATGKVLIERPSEVWTQDYLIGSSPSVTSDNQSKALDTIIEDLSQKIYQRTLVELPKLEQQKPQ